jgi:hypothetical protein
MGGDGTRAATPPAGTPQQHGFVVAYAGGKGERFPRTTGRPLGASSAANPVHSLMAQRQAQWSCEHAACGVASLQKAPFASALLEPPLSQFDHNEDLSVLAQIRRSPCQPFPPTIVLQHASAAAHCKGLCATTRTLAGLKFRLAADAKRGQEKRDPPRRSAGVHVLRLRKPRTRAAAVRSSPASCSASAAPEQPRMEAQPPMRRRRGRAQALALRCRCRCCPFRATATPDVSPTPHRKMRGAADRARRPPRAEAPSTCLPFACMRSCPSHADGHPVAVSGRRTMLPGVKVRSYGTGLIQALFHTARLLRTADTDYFPELLLARRRVSASSPSRQQNGPIQLTPSLPQLQGSMRHTMEPSAVPPGLSIRCGQTRA